MSYYTTTQFRIGPERAPKIIRSLIWTTVIIAIGSALLDLIFVRFLNVPGPTYYLALSWQGLQQGFLWQIITYLFIQQVAPNGITLYLLLTLFFNMYVIWAFGSALAEQVGNKSFLTLYIGSGIAGAVGAIYASSFLGYNFALAGSAPSTFALFLVWVMVYPEMDVLFFFLVPFKAKWLLAGWIIGIALLEISAGLFIELGALTFALTFGYIYAIMVEDFHSPYKVMDGIDNALRKLKNAFKHKPKGKDKIIDISTGIKLTDDDIFMDKMLEKISKKGEQSLSWNEKERMKQISEKKGQDKKPSVKL